jgi:hypothetical protein
MLERTFSARLRAAQSGWITGPAEWGAGHRYSPHTKLHNLTYCLHVRFNIIAHVHSVMPIWLITRGLLRHDTVQSCPFVHLSARNILSATRWKDVP